MCSWGTATRSLAVCPQRNVFSFSPAISSSHRRRRWRVKDGNRMLPRGSIVGGYRMEARIGKGSFGEVYKAQLLRDETVVALKLVSLTREEEVISAERLGALLQQRFEKAHGMV